MVLVSKPREDTLAVGDQMRFKRGTTVARRLKVNPAGVRQDLLLAVSVAVIAVGRASGPGTESECKRLADFACRTRSATTVFSLPRSSSVAATFYGPMFFSAVVRALFFANRIPPSTGSHDPLTRPVHTVFGQLETDEVHGVSAGGRQS